jgi:hypothetical protein
MARPSPNILLRDVEPSGKALEVCEADALYGVLYQGKPIKVRTLQNIDVSFLGPKYSKTAFPESGHAYNLAEKLNRMFNTTDFSVAIMVVGRTISE